MARVLSDFLNFRMVSCRSGVGAQGESCEKLIIFSSSDVQPISPTFTGRAFSHLWGSEMEALDVEKAVDTFCWSEGLVATNVHTKRATLTGELNGGCFNKCSNMLQGVGPWSTRASARSRALSASLIDPRWMSTSTSCCSRRAACNRLHTSREIKTLHKGKLLTRLGPYGCSSKKWYQNGTLVNGTKD